MDPLSALSIASAVIQIVDFSSKVIARTREVYQSADGSIEEITLIEDATANLDDLMKDLMSKTEIEAFTRGAFDRKTPDQQLIQLAEDSNTLANELNQTLKACRVKKDGSQRGALSQGLRSVLEQKSLTTLKQKLDELRKQIDTTLLITIRQGMTNGSVRKKPPPNETAEFTDRKVTFLAAVRDHDWQPTTQHDLAAFSDRLISSIDMDIEERFLNAILGRLYFADMSDRHSSIPQAHRETFQWIYKSRVHKDSTNWDSFANWLSASDDKNVYWVTGKPGSGKSTLMKFMFDNPSTWNSLKSWSHSKPLTKAGFFFWNSGTVMQMSRQGLIQSLLYSSLKEDNNTLLNVFKQRYQQFLGFGGGRQPLVWSELREAFETMISAPLTPRNFFFMIDGLDEFDGDSKELIELVLSIADHPHVKICVASRPWLVFSDAFADRPSLRLEDLTRNDVQNYIKSFFANNQHYTRLARLEPTGASSLIDSIAEKSAGVFLWVYLVVRSLLDGLSNADRLSDLVRRLNALPPGLEELFSKLLRSLDADYFTHACQLLRLVAGMNRPHLLYLYFADNEDENSTIQDETRSLSPDEILSRLETMDRRLMSRCKGFLEVDNRSTQLDQPLSEDSRVGWIHRTAKDFLTSGTLWQTVLEATGHDAFDIERRWANASMGIFKTTPASLDERWTNLRICIDYAILVEFSHNVCPVEYLNELWRSTVQRRIYESGGSSPDIPLSQIRSPLDFAVHFCLVSYINAIGPIVTREELTHARKTERMPRASRLYLDRTDSVSLLGAGFEYIRAREKRESESRAYYSLRSPARLKEALRKIEIRVGTIEKGRKEGRWERTKKRIF
ncbi:hypothetical protein HBI25_223290 [Parastagonospora nodorum]|nr:hypothetical protein HBH75_204360 [Parastagonospora nodorum]KAH4983490.1 hypothetical protein HBI76_152250 [Parastagonospora nodorum]KAH5233338.1 hypothetical protein HBI62_039960 [Parastagonospora nodorum]KAH5287719.1 hypothetical protein HBI70_001410 [Parastagonospora nodorum]KAH5357669.1 hypothetical protein HBI33_201830 [Parastagonospora nodorum]